MSGGEQKQSEKFDNDNQPDIAEKGGEAGYEEKEEDMGINSLHDSDKQEESSNLD